MLEIAEIVELIVRKVENSIIIEIMTPTQQIVEIQKIKEILKFSEISISANEINVEIKRSF